MKTITYLSLITLGALGAFSPANAQIIGLQFVGSGNALTSSETTGVVAQDYFNVVTGVDFTNTTGFVYGDGSPVASLAVSVSGNNFSDFTKTSYTGTGPNYDLMSGSIGSHSQSYSDGDHFALTLTNIPFALYNVYVYVDQDGRDRSAELTTDANSTGYYYDAASDSGTAQGGFDGTFTQVTTTTPGSSTPSDYPIGEYILLTGLTSSELTIYNFNAPNSTSNGPAVGISAIQIVDAATAPEPGTSALLVLGGLLLVVLRKRSGKAKA